MKEKVRGVYFLKSKETGLTKIGKSKDIASRFSQIKTMSSAHLELYHIIETNHESLLEKRLHQRFASKRKHGEWFSLDLMDLNIVIPDLEAQWRRYSIARLALKTPEQSLVS